jgi:hypothetical protein
MTNFRILPGLPPYGEMPRAFPAEWGRLGREGLVVAFQQRSGRSWMGNFAPGICGVTAVHVHPDGHRVLVIHAGDGWVVDPETGAAERVLRGIAGLWPLSAPAGFLVDSDGLAFARLAADGVRWHTRRLSWDGFSDVAMDEREVRGLAWNPIDDAWQPFEVDLQTGSSRGGSYGDQDLEGWEQLATPFG